MMTSSSKRPGEVQTSVALGRTISAMLSKDDLEARAELDSHADTCVVGGKSAMILDTLQRPVTVRGYDPRSDSTVYQTVNAAIAISVACKRHDCKRCSEDAV